MVTQSVYANQNYKSKSIVCAHGYKWVSDGYLQLWCACAVFNNNSRNGFINWYLKRFVVEQNILYAMHKCDSQYCYCYYNVFAAAIFGTNTRI